jgi:hypothetical protein
MSAQRLGRRGLERLRNRLSDRDLAILRNVDAFRLLTTRQIEAFHFHDHATTLTGARSARRVLERLTRDRVLVRLERRIGGVRAGSASYIYAVGPAGHRILHDDSSRRWREPSETFVTHTLTVADLVIALTQRDRAGEAELVEYGTEPGCWRDFPRPMAGTQTLKPDLVVVTATEESELRWFVEIDLATESGPAIVRKCRTYHAYWQSGIEQDRHDVFPKVLWVADTTRRAGLIRRAITKARSLHRPLFDVTTADKAIAVLAGGEQ